MPCRSEPYYSGSLMPICEADPWRMQYFEGADCPPGVNVPTEDADAWEWNPEFRWIYDKIVIARNQGLDAGPHGTLPPSFPVFSKPIVNLKGMGVDTRIIHSAADYALHQTSGHMWMIMLEGRHVSTDVAIVGGEPRWWRHVTGQAGRRGHVRSLDRACGSRAQDRTLLRRMDRASPARLHRHAEYRDHRRAHDRNASALQRSMA